jgi:hypothetical protein
LATRIVLDAAVETTVFEEITVLKEKNIKNKLQKDYNFFKNTPKKNSTSKLPHTIFKNSTNHTCNPQYPPHEIPRQMN